jgi:chromosomal replication initiation ATPase DnaA
MHPGVLKVKLEGDMIREIVKETAAEFLVDPQMILGKNQEARIVEARRNLVLRLRNRGMSFPTIGRWLNRHHTSIIHLCQTATQSERQKALAFLKPSEERPKKIGWPVPIQPGDWTGAA